MAIINQKQIRPTTKQLDYMLLLFNDCGFDETSKYAWLSARYNRKIRHLDELWLAEACSVIDDLKVIRQNDKSPR